MRIVGSSASLADATSLAEWLDVPEHATYSFSPGTRTTALTTNLQPFSSPHSFALLRQMVKPAYDAMRTASGGTIAFVPSRSQCRATAKDLITQSASDLESSFVADGALETVATYAETVTDPDLAEALTHGIAVFHEGLPAAEQRLALELFGSGVVRVLVASREACWTLPVRASLVVLMSAQYVALRTGADGHEEREIEDYGMPEVLQMQSLAVPPSPESSAEFLVLCQKDQSELYDKFLQHGVVLESALPLDPLLAAAAFGDLVDGRIKDRQDLVDLLSWTLAARRLDANPSFYLPDLATSSSSSEDLLSRLADSVVDELERRCAVISTGRTDFALSALGRYYASAGVSLDEVERLQGLELAELVKGSGGGGGAKVPKKRAPVPVAPKVNGEAATNGDGGAAPEQEQEQEPVEVKAPLAQDANLSAFHQRLPRAVKNVVGERGELDLGEWERRVLLAAFRAGRVPRGKGGLEEKQRELVERVVRSRV